MKDKITITTENKDWVLKIDLQPHNVSEMTGLLRTIHELESKAWALLDDLQPKQGVKNG